MENDIAISVKGISKQYRRGRRKRDDTLRDSLARIVTNPKAIFNKQDSEMFWALKDINFEVKKGEVVGIIGKNGSGKSTLLKILSRITQPTKGEAILSSKVSSLLEVGTGFNPELTGRENVYLNGSILGMSRAEIRKKFSDIVEFADIGDFIDTPVKRYSSGMYVRLAFAVAAHLEPEIMLVDEVLAVGDVEFQKKCLGKMGEVAQHGRTILFVSHNMGAIEGLCDRAIVLERGKVKFIGSSHKAIEVYLKTEATEAEYIGKHEDNSEAFIQRVNLYDSQDNIVNQPLILSDIKVEVTYKIVGSIKRVSCGFEVINSNGVVVFTTTDEDEGGNSNAANMGTYTSRVTLPKELFRSGVYQLDLYLTNPGVKIYDNPKSAIGFEFLEPANSLKSKLGYGRRGVVEPVIKWKIKHEKTK